MRSRSILLLILILFLFSGCISVQPVKVNSVQCCELRRISGADTEVAFEMEIENPNHFNITVMKYDLAVKINGNRIGQAVATEPSVLSPNSVQMKKVTVRTSAKKLISGTLLMGLNALLKKDPTTLEVEIVGSVVGKAKGVSRRIKVHETYPLEMHP